MEKEWRSVLATIGVRGARTLAQFLNRHKIGPTEVILMESRNDATKITILIYTIVETDIIPNEIELSGF